VNIALSASTYDDATKSVRLLTDLADDEDDELARGFFPTCRDFYVPRSLRRPTTKHLVILLAIFIDLLPPKFAAPELRRSPKSKHVHVPKELTIMDMPSAPTLVQQRPRQSWGKERHLWSTLFR